MCPGSGNGLVSYYINLVLEGVGISNAGTKAAINGGLQVRSQIHCNDTSLPVWFVEGVESHCGYVGRVVGRQAWPKDTLYHLKRRHADRWVKHCNPSGVTYLILEPYRFWHMDTHYRTFQHL